MVSLCRRSLPYTSCVVSLSPKNLPNQMGYLHPFHSEILTLKNYVFRDFKADRNTWQRQKWHRINSGCISLLDYCCDPGVAHAGLVEWLTGILHGLQPPLMLWVSPVLLTNIFSAACDPATTGVFWLRLNSIQHNILTSVHTVKWQTTLRKSVCILQYTHFWVCLSVHYCPTM